MKTIYSELDRQLKNLKKKVRDEFVSLSLAGFDELNVIGTRKRTEKLYKHLKEENEKAYIKSAKEAYYIAQEYAILAGYENEKKATGIDKIWLAAVLGMYHLATGYLYNSETDRKRMRLNEEILTAREYSDHAALKKAVRKGMDLWWTQTMQHGIYVADDACITAYKDYGVERVKWIANIDGKECKICRERHGKIYDINNVPEKPHYGCRCRLEPISKGEN